MRVHASGASAAVVHVRRRGGDWRRYAADVTLTDAQGVVLVEVTGLRSRAVRRRRLLRTGDAAQALYRLGLVCVACWAGCCTSGRWIVIGAADDALAGALVERVLAASAACNRVGLEDLPGALPAEHVVCMWGGTGESADAAEAARRLSSAGLLMVQLLAQQSEAPRLWWVTRGAVAVTVAEAAEVAQASLWGLGRTVMQEHPELTCTLIDMEAGAGPRISCFASSRSRTRSGRSSCAAESGAWRACCVRRAGACRNRRTTRWRWSAKGCWTSLGLVPAGRRRPRPGEVEIEVRASGLNFRDVMNALGMLGMYPGAAGPLGSECSGVVTAVGEGVEGIVAGDSVMGFAAGSFGRFVVTDARLVVGVPSGLSLEQAATIPVVFLTAWYALHDLAGLKSGERLLVHAAAGGVGMAAVQIAQWKGAEVFGTASAAKWDVVRSLGVKAVADSRDLSFVGAIREAVGGAHIDVVLNSLSGEFVDASLSLLGPGGRFIEMGKTDIREAASMSASHPDVRYRAFDLPEAGVERLGVMLASIAEGFAAGRLTPLPVRRFAMAEAESAFRFMAQARHVGKLALVPPRSLRTDGTVLITGGLGALGLMSRGGWRGAG